MEKSVVTFLKSIVSAIAVLVFVIAISGCEKQEGPMEKAGKKVDEGVEAAKKSAEKTGKKADEGNEPPRSRATGYQRNKAL